MCFFFTQEFVDLCLSLASGELDESLQSSLSMVPKIRGLLTAISEEDWETPLFYHIPSLMNRVKVEVIKTWKFK